MTSLSCLSVVRSDPKHLCLLSTSLGTAVWSSAETGLQAVDEVADDCQDEKEDDDNDRNGDVARHGEGCGGVVGWVVWLMSSEACACALNIIV